MGKKKYNLKKKSLRENAEFDMMEGGDEPLLDAKIKNKPMIISSKKAKKKAKKSFLKASSLNKALNTMDTMEDVVQQKGKQPSQGWHRVTLANAAKFNKEIVLQSLANGSPQAFTPVCFTKNNADYSFYVESPSVATALKSLDRKISVTHNFLMRIKVNPSPAPKHFLNEEVKQKIKEVMSKRYNIQNKSLDLKCFHNDTMFVGEAAYVPLSRSNVMNNVIRIIGEHIPDIQAIDFSENKLPSLDHFSMLEDNAPNLQFLNLSNNRLNDFRDIEKLKNLKLKSLTLANNALTKKLPDRVDFVAKIREILPKLEILDEESLPKSLLFEDQDHSQIHLPPTINLMSVNEEGKKVMLEFIQQYFKAYDKDDRSALMAAYHPKALFSLSSAYPPGSTAHGNNKLTHYQCDSRNLNLILQPSKRMTFLKRGAESVMRFICDLPKTIHDLDTFTLDLPLVNAQLINVNITGVFKERALSPAPLRHFHRCFVIVPQGSGFVIVNDSLYITNPTILQSKIAFKDSMEKPIMPVIQPEQAQKVVLELCKLTKLRPDWAEKCLQETKWNLDGAFAAFQIAKNENKIPVEAYAFLG